MSDDVHMRQGGIAGRLFADKRAFKASSLRFDGQTGAG